MFNPHYSSKTRDSPWAKEWPSLGMTLQPTSQIPNPHLGSQRRLWLLREDFSALGTSMPRAWLGTVGRSWALHDVLELDLLRLWSASASALTRLFRQGPGRPAPAFLRRSVLCGLGAAPRRPHADQGFSWSSHPPCQPPRKAVSSGDECYFIEMSPFRKIMSGCFVSRSDFSQGFHSSAACVGCHASLLSGTTWLILFLAAYTEFDCFLLWSVTVYFSSCPGGFAESGQPLGCSVLMDVCIKHPPLLLGSCPGHLSS